MEDAKEAFLAYKRGAFTLYYGFDTSPKNWAYKNDDIADPSEAWEILETEIIRRSRLYGGNFTVFVPNGQGNGNFGFKFFISLQGSQSAPGGEVGVAGIGQLGGIQGYLDLALDKNRKEFELIRLQEKLEEQEAVIEQLQKGEGINGWLNNILTPETVQPLINAIGGMIAQRFIGGAAPASVSGVGFTPQQNHPAPSGTEGDQEVDIEMSDEAWGAVADLQNSLGEKFDDLIKMLSWYIRTNPGMVGTLVSMIKPQYDAAHKKANENNVSGA